MHIYIYIYICSSAASRLCIYCNNMYSIIVVMKYIRIYVKTYTNTHTHKYLRKMHYNVIVWQSLMLVYKRVNYTSVLMVYKRVYKRINDTVIYDCQNIHLYKYIHVYIYSNSCKYLWEREKERDTLATLL